MTSSRAGSSSGATPPTGGRCGAGRAEGTAPCGSSPRSPTGRRPWPSSARPSARATPYSRDLDALADIPWGLWCGEWDPFRDGAVALADAAPVAPDPWVGGDGGHTRAYWNAHTLEMLDRLAREL